MTTATATAPAKLEPAQHEMLTYFAGVEGADVWDRPQAHVCRELQTLGLLRIVKARGAPKDGAMRQPFFGAKITAAGRRALGHS